MSNSTVSRVGCDCRRTKLILLLTCSCVIGCGSQEEIRHYKVPKPEILYAQNHVDKKTNQTDAMGQPTEPTDRLLGAIVPRESQTWYFKMTGPMDLVAKQEPRFRKLIESLTFDAPGSPPKWTLPESWEQQKGTGMRQATLGVTVDGQRLEVSVIQLPTDPSPTSLLENVNRWRKEMRLPAIDQERLESKTEVVELSDGMAVLVNLVGNFTSGTMGRTVPRTASKPRSGLKYEAPPGWTPQELVMFSVLTLGTAEGDSSAQITVSPMRGDGGGLVMNLQRWYEKAGLSRPTADELKKQTEQLEVNGIAGTYAEIMDGEDDQAVIGWIGIQADRSWFIKMSGDTKLVDAQRDAFRSFLKTLQFNAP